MNSEERSFSQEKGLANSAVPTIETRVWNLRWWSREVKAEDNPAELADLMFRVMKERQAQGLSAVQVGRRLRLFVLLDEPGAPLCLVNPVITKSKGSIVAVEGCLSIPAPEGTKDPYLRMPVPRPKRITIQGLNQYMRPVRYRFVGALARRACHEMDHLNGKLITDYQEEKVEDSNL